MNIELLTSVLFVALWTAAWLHWVFNGEIRHFLFAYVFPEAWSAGRPKEDILLLGRQDFTIFLASESNAPGFIRGVLGCPGCLSAYISVPGTALAFMGSDFSPWLLPLVWAGGAWIGRALHHKF